LRDGDKESSSEKLLTRQQADEVKEKRTEARTALRNEIGSTNLNVAQSEYTAY
jgi:hypothetical protein